MVSFDEVFCVVLDGDLASSFFVVEILMEFSTNDEAHGGLDIAGSDGGLLLVVAGELGSLGGNLLQHGVNEGVHDGHTRCTIC
jgi:sigma54-dependent transcription regulator